MDGMSAHDDIARGWPLPGDSLPIEFSQHATERYNRLRPGIEPDAAYHALCHMLAGARAAAEPPAWAEHNEGATAWLLLGEDYAAACSPCTLAGNMPLPCAAGSGTSKNARSAPTTASV